MPNQQSGHQRDSWLCLAALPIRIILNVLFYEAATYNKTLQQRAVQNLNVGFLKIFLP